MSLAALQEKIKKSLDKNNFGIINEYITKDKLRIIANFGDILGYSTFFIEKEKSNNNLIIGANITLDTKTLTKSLSNKIHTIASAFNISCSPISYNDKEGTGTLSLQVVYSFLRYNEINFILYVNNFKKCVEALYIDIKRCLQYEEALYLDLSMFENVDWNIFDPYICVMERDKKHKGSWELYIVALKKRSKAKDELKYVQICKKFEDLNGIPLDLVCDYVVEQIMFKLDDQNKKDKLN